MAEQSKFAGALARLKQPTAERAAAEPAVMDGPATPSPRQAAVATGSGKGRPATGKRSDPEWNRYTILLRKKTHKQASRRLQDLDTGQDLSELMDQLLTEWLER
jgi:hypothetical protein